MVILVDNKLGNNLANPSSFLYLIVFSLDRQLIFFRTFEIFFLLFSYKMRIARILITNNNIIGTVWSISAALASPMLFKDLLIYEHFPVAMMERTHGLVLLVIAFLVPCVALVLVYFKMYVAAHSFWFLYNLMI
ncbi:D(4) dopamine receptor-like [Aphis craccivora]|uniref:D(4) dopamine receptor-like n=1 Tax=Aphis craccivora TaxID=307492 RepID=A0A6G0ZNC8_APHCR|nr:D(4) dopamine receptor-like [Aphis craccivora]